MVVLKRCMPQWRYHHLYHCTPMRMCGYIRQLRRKREGGATMQKWNCCSSYITQHLRVLLFAFVLWGVFYKKKCGSPLYGFHCKEMMFLWVTVVHTPCWWSLALSIRTWALSFSRDQVVLELNSSRRLLILCLQCIVPPFKKTTLAYYAHYNGTVQLYNKVHQPYFTNSLKQRMEHFGRRWIRAPRVGDE